MIITMQTMNSLANARATFHDNEYTLITALESNVSLEANVRDKLLHAKKRRRHVMIMARDLAVISDESVGNDISREVGIQATTKRKLHRALSFVQLLDEKPVRQFLIHYFFLNTDYVVVINFVFQREIQVEKIVSINF